MSLDRRVTYQIELHGVIEVDWSDWVVEMKVMVDYDEEGLPMLTLTGNFNRVALQGLLRRLYSLGIPLISVNWVDD